MELFLIYLVTRLTELKAALGSLSKWTAFAVVCCLIVRYANEYFTEVSVRDAQGPDSETSGEVYAYRHIRSVSSRGLKMFLPVFLLSFVVNMLLPTTRDAVVIAGGYGLVEAVHNERVQRLFNKSTSVASHWLEAQLTADDQAAEKATQAATPAVQASAPSPVASAPAPKKLLEQVKDKVVDRVTERVADEVLGAKPR